MPLTFQAIVCMVDFSSFSPSVVAYGVSFARRADVRLYLFHAVHHPQDGVHPTTVFERGGDLAQLTADARQRMQTLMAHVSMDWEAVVRFGDPVEETIAFVNRLPASLVISASHGVSGLRRLFTGTVVERLTRKLGQPMLVIKPVHDETIHRFDGFRLAVVSCDGRGYWQRLAPLLPLVQAESDSRVHLVHALEGPMADTAGEDSAASYEQTQSAQSDRLSHNFYHQAQRLFPYADAHAVTVAPGIPQEMVLRVARERACDIIAVGVRRSGTLGRWISGSTTEALLRHSPCCVLTVPEPSATMTSGGHHR
jgi:nucleotide-binding universal stress UspA family protein